MAGVIWEAAEIGRLFHTHQLDPGLIAPALGITQDDAARLKQGDPSAHGVIGEHGRHAALLLNVLVRLELRCGHDSAAVRAALERPAEGLGGDSIGDRLRGEVDLELLRLLREIAGTLPVHKVKFWRCADRYS